MSPGGLSPAQLIQFTAFISHLTNSNRCGNLDAKVLLTVSPFLPSFPPQPRVCSRNQLLLSSYAPRGANISPILSTLRILPVATGCTSISLTLCLCASVANPVVTHLSPVASYCCKLFVAPKKVKSFAIKQIQTLFTKHPGGGWSHHSRWRAVAQPRPHGPRQTPEFASRVSPLRFSILAEQA